ncbi:MAG TPA: glycosyltransferase, partial [Candidatus Marinimicrobia bacterium]|nr:glycosyltransferase [Candidatus Neomarinimicrobiota bacterium]
MSSEGEGRYCGVKTLIVTPTYNERKNIRELVSTLFVLNPDYHILVVDDSSPDGTAEIVEKLQADYDTLHLLSRDEKGGLGSAYIAGFNYALERD